MATRSPPWSILYFDSRKSAIDIESGMKFPKYINRLRYRIAANLGFTLIEMAVVIFLMAILATAGLKLLSSQIENAAYAAVAKKQETIKQALITYLGKFKRLPCPDNQAVPDGNETRNPGAANTPADCTAFFGRVPYVTLGLSRDTAIDGWDSYFSYAVSQPWTLSLAANLPSAAGIAQTNDPTLAFSVGSVGSLTVNDRLPSTNALPTAIADPASGGGAAAIIISHGKNSLGAYTVKGTQITPPVAGTDEAENINGANSIYFKRDYTDSDVPTNGAFDDMVMIIKPDDLVSPLSRDGSIKSSAASLNEQLATIRDTAIGRFAQTTACTIPQISALNLPALATTDPWGQPIQYVASPAGPLSTASPQQAGEIAIKFWSRGPNKVDDGESGIVVAHIQPCSTTSDNICLTISYDMLRSRVPPSACP